MRSQSHPVWHFPLCSVELRDFFLGNYCVLLLRYAIIFIISFSFFYSCIFVYLLSCCFFRSLCLSFYLSYFFLSFFIWLYFLIFFTRYPKSVYKDRWVPVQPVLLKVFFITFALLFSCSLSFSQPLIFLSFLQIFVSSLYFLLLFQISSFLILPPAPLPNIFLSFVSLSFSDNRLSFTLFYLSFAQFSLYFFFISSSPIFFSFLLNLNLFLPNFHTFFLSCFYLSFSQPLTFFTFILRFVSSLCFSLLFQSLPFTTPPSLPINIFSLLFLSLFLTNP